MLETEPSLGRGTDGRRAVGPSTRHPRWSAVAGTLIFTAVLAVLLQLRFGYSAGTNDHLVLSLQGLQWARKGWLVHDWFVASAPQPHVLFDVVTWAGAAIGHLSAVYFTWWLAGLIVGGAATALLAAAWTPTRPVRTCAVVAALIGLGPQVALGTTTPALPTALPQELGGFLAYLTVALLLTRRPRGAAVALVACSVVHVQLGAIAAVVAALAFVAVAVLERRLWWSVPAAVVVSAGVVVTVLKVRPVASDGQDFVEICRDVIPYHCDATTWSGGQLYSGFAIVLAALLCLPLVIRAGAAPDQARSDVGLWTVTLLVPAVGLTAGVLANRYDVPVLGTVAQSTNVFRLAVLLVPFGAWGLVAGFHRMRGTRLLIWTAAAGVAAMGWLVPKDGSTALHGAWHWAALVLVLAGAGVLARVRIPAGMRWLVVRAGVTGTLGLAALATVVAGAAATNQVKWRPVNITFVPQADFRAMGRMVAAHVPPGAVVQAPPTLGVIRLAAGRSVVVDCKAVPYGGPAWRDYRERLDAIGGRGGCNHGGHPYLEVPAPLLIDAAEHYGARYMVLTEQDPREPDVLASGWRVLAAPQTRTGDVWLLAAPGAPDDAPPS